MPVKDSSKIRKGHSERNRLRGRRSKNLPREFADVDTEPTKPLQREVSTPKDAQALANLLFEQKVFKMNKETYKRWARDSMILFMKMASSKDRMDLALNVKRIKEQLDRQYGMVKLNSSHYEKISENFRVEW